jgi:hypothetical protein
MINNFGGDEVFLVTDWYIYEVRSETMNEGITYSGYKIKFHTEDEVKIDIGIEVFDM